MAENFTEGDLAFHSLAVDGIRARCCETRRLCTRNHARVGSPFEPSDGGLELNSATVEHKQLVCERNWEALLAARMVGRWQQGGIQGHPLGLQMIGVLPTLILWQPYGCSKRLMRSRCRIRHQLGMRRL